MSWALVVFILIATVLFWTAAVTYNTARTRKADDSWALAQGCLPPPKLDTGRWPLGLELIVKAFKIAEEQRLLRFFTNVVDRTGPTFEQKLLGFRGIDTSDPVNIEAILSKQFKDFGLGERRLVFFPLLGDGIFTQDGKLWEHSRALLRPAFQHNREQALNALAGAANRAVDSIKCNQAIDLQPVFFRFTLDTTMFLLFGQTLDEASTGADSEKAFAAAFDEGQDYLARRGRLGGLYWLIDDSHFRKQCQNVHRYIDAAIARALRSDKHSDAKSVYTILGALVEQTKDMKVLREQCLNVLLAGRDTTACLLTWTFRLLARHPRVLEKCRADIKKVCNVSPPTRADMKRMRYLDAVFKEVLRLYPSVPINSRTAQRTTTLPRGGGPDGTAPVMVRKGEAVGYCPYVMHRCKDKFGKDAAIFRPERWLENGGQLAITAGYGYLPFNAGPRICLGQEFAILEATYLSVRILQAFAEIILPDDEPLEDVGDERQKLTLVLSSATGCRLFLSSSNSIDPL